MSDMAEFTATIAEPTVETPTTPTEEIVETTEPTDEGSVADPVAEEEENPFEEEEEAEPKKLDPKAEKSLREKQVKAAIEEIKKSGDTKTAKLLHDTYFRFETLKNELGVETVDQARVLKATLDSAGGVEGIASLQSKASTLDVTDANFDKGDPSVVKEMSEAYPEGFKKIAPQVLETLKAMDIKAYENVIRPHGVELLESAGFMDALGQIEEALKGENPEAARKVLQTMAAWFNNQKKQAGDAAPKVDPDREKFNKDVQEFESKKEREYRNGVGAAASVKYDALITKSLTPYIKSLKLSPAAQKLARNDIFAEVKKLNDANKTFGDSVKAAWASKTRDAKQIQAYIEANLDIVVPKAVNSVMKSRYGGVAMPKTTPTATTPTKDDKPNQKMGGAVMPVKLSREPSDGEIDWAKDKNQVLWLTNKAYLKSGPNKGKLVTW